MYDNNINISNKLNTYNINNNYLILKLIIFSIIIDYKLVIIE